MITQKQRIEGFLQHLRKQKYELDKVIYQHEVNVLKLSRQEVINKVDTQIIKGELDLLKDLAERRNTLNLITKQYLKQFITKEEFYF